MPPRTDRVVDLRSDTVTQPTDEMREAMRNARVGDDTMGEDPTVNELEALGAERLGKPAALFLPTGTMANQVAIFTHTRRRGEVVLEQNSHINVFECGAAALFSGVLLRPIAGTRGVFTGEQLSRVLQKGDLHTGPTTLVSVENTHNWASGAVWTPTQTRDVARATHEFGVPLHLDGARLFNSAVAQGVSPSTLAADADSVMVSLSKGLSAPVGSLLAGPQEFIDRARWARKAFGGGMRQAGVIAAAGIVALTTMVDRLAEDHAHARRLAERLVKLPGLRVDLEAVRTNIVIFNVEGTRRTAPELCAALREHGILAEAFDDRHVRYVTHRHVGRADVDYVLQRTEEALGARTRAPAAPGGSRA